jgi:hypothetical protein
MDVILDPKRSFLRVQAEPGFAGFFVRAMAREAVIGENRENIAAERRGRSTPGTAEHRAGGNGSEA